MPLSDESGRTSMRDVALCPDIVQARILVGTTNESASSFALAADGTVFL